MHQRQIIIDKIVALLTGVTGLPVPKELDVMPAPGSNQPVVRVYAAGESSERSRTELEDARRLRIEVKVSVNRAAGFQTLLNNACEAVEAKLGQKPTLDGVADSFEFTGWSPDFGAVSEIDAASAVLNYEAAYVFTPTISADAFLTMNVEIDMAGPRNDPQSPTEPDGQIDASATIALPT